MLPAHRAVPVSASAGSSSTGAGSCWPRRWQRHRWYWPRGHLSGRRVAPAEMSRHPQHRTNTFEPCFYAAVVLLLLYCYCWVVASDVAAVVLLLLLRPCCCCCGLAVAAAALLLLLRPRCCCCCSAVAAAALLLLLRPRYCCCCSAVAAAALLLHSGFLDCAHLLLSGPDLRLGLLPSGCPSSP